MTNKQVPSLRGIRYIRPDLEHVVWDTLNTSNVAESDGGLSFINVSLGETLNMKFVLNNTAKSRFSEVTLKVEVSIETANEEPEILLPFENLTLEPDTPPNEATFTYTFERVSQYRIAFSLTYKMEKSGATTIDKVYTFHCNDPLSLSHKAIRLSNGKTYLETRIRNNSACKLTLSNVRLINKADESCIFPINRLENKGKNIYVVRPDDCYGIIFSNECSKNLLDDFQVSLSWKSSTRANGSITSKVDTLNRKRELAYQVVACPSIIKAHEPFNLQISVENLSAGPLNCTTKFDLKSLKPFFVRINDCMEIGKLKQGEKKIIDIPLVCTSNGSHNVSGIEIHCGEHVVSVDIIEILVL